MTIVEELRNKKSVYNRDLLDRAANTIERLDTENKRYRRKELEASPDVTWICVYKDTLGFREGDDNLTMVCLPTRWLKSALKSEGVLGFEPWLESYTADETESIIIKAMREGVIVDFDDEWMKPYFASGYHIFEGKRSDNGEWVYGRLLADNVIVPIGQTFEVDDSYINSELEACFVDTDTISEFSIMYGEKLAVECSEEEGFSNDNDGHSLDAVFDMLSPLKKELYSHKKEFGNIIPDKYMFHGSYKDGGGRSSSPIGMLLSSMKLEDIHCPACEEKALRDANFGSDSMFPDYRVACDACDYICPCGSEDCGEAIGEFEFWMEAFLLLGAPRDRLKEDLSLFFYPEEWRKAIIEERENED